MAAACGIPSLAGWRRERLTDLYPTSSADSRHAMTYVDRYATSCMLTASLYMENKQTSTPGWADPTNDAAIVRLENVRLWWKVAKRIHSCTAFSAHGLLPMLWSRVDTHKMLVCTNGDYTLAPAISSSALAMATYTERSEGLRPPPSSNVMSKPSLYSNLDSTSGLRHVGSRIVLPAAMVRGLNPDTNDVTRGSRLVTS